MKITKDILENFKNMDTVIISVHFGTKNPTIFQYSGFLVKFSKHHINSHRLNDRFALIGAGNQKEIFDFSSGQSINGSHRVYIDSVRLVLFEKKFTKNYSKSIIASNLDKLELQKNIMIQALHMTQE